MKNEIENTLINDILKKVTGPYSDWKIGITSTGRMNSEGIAACTYYGYTTQEVLESFDYFTQNGMMPIHKIGLDAVNLYIFNINGIRVSGSHPTYNEEGIQIN